MSWTVALKESALGDLRWFGRRDGRMLLNEMERLLSADPRAESRRMKTLRLNPFAQRELRLFGKYRVLFNVDDVREEVIVLLVGEKRGDKLLVRGQEFTAHHESDSVE